MKQVEIKTTTNHDQFKKITGNRPVNEKKVKKMVQTIKEGANFLPFCPVIVDEKFRIMDGQHRLAACRILNHPVYYVVAKNRAKVSDVSNLNTNATSWSLANFIDSYAKQGVVSYQQLSRLKGKFSWAPFGILAAMCSGLKMDGGGVTEKIKSGEFKADGYDVCLAFLEALSENIHAFEKLNTPMLRALWGLRKNSYFSLGELGAKSITSGQKVKKASTPKECFHNLEAVYNYHRRGRVVLYGLNKES